MDELHGRQKIIAQLVEARLEQGVSQAELARRVGTQRSNICRLESGVQNPTLDMIFEDCVRAGERRFPSFGRQGGTYEQHLQSAYLRHGAYALFNGEAGIVRPGGRNRFIPMRNRPTYCPWIWSAPARALFTGWSGG